MKLSSTAIKELSSQYRSVLKKCFILNAIVLMAAAPAMAERISEKLSEDLTIDGQTFANETWTVASGSAADGAALQYSAKTGTTPTLTITNTTIANNTLNDSDKSNGAYGGAVSIGGGINVIMDNVTMSQNIATTSGGVKAKTQGGAYWQSTGTLDANALTITNNSTSGYGASQGGAWALFAVSGSIENSDFSTNKSTVTDGNWPNQGGALYLSGASWGGQPDRLLEISKTTFTSNSIDAKWAYGGAISVSGAKVNQTDTSKNAYYALELDNVNMSNNFTNGDEWSLGGAIYASNAKVSITNSTFANNSAASKQDGSWVMGGAIYNAKKDDTNDNNLGILNITSSTFTGNKAVDGYGYGGAIYNYGILTITDTSFTGNEAGYYGGALYNEEGGVITLAGTNTFSGNKAYGALNDIHNNGTLNVSGVLTLDGGITADEGLGSVVFADNTSLTAALKNSTIVANSVEFIGDNVVLNLTNIAAGTYDLIDASITGNFKLSDEVLNNAVFDITKDGYKITAQTKSAEDIADNLGVSEDTAQVVGGLGEVAASNEKAQAALNIIMDTNTPQELREQIVENINPTSAPVVQSVATEVNGQIMNLVGARLAPATGRAGGDYKIEAGGVWAKGLYSRAKQDGAFRGYTQGIAMGIDSVIEDVFTLGVGYAYNTTDIKADARKTEVKGHNFFAYGEYQPSEWFVNGALSYSKSNYEEQRQLSGNGAEYTVETYGAQAMAGYDFANGITPQAGLRYLRVTQDSHTDAFGRNVSAKATDLLTAVAGVNYGKDFAGEKVTFTPQVRLAATYDVVSDGAEANVVLGSSSYTVKGDRLPRFGVEAGVGMQLSIADCVDVNVDYDLAVRRDYTSHTGTVSLKYNF